MYIGRPNKWGNPFSIGLDGTREEVIDKYEAWIHTQPNLLNDLAELSNKVLGCWCYPNKCHGDILIKLLNNKEEGIMATEITGIIEAMSDRPAGRGTAYNFKVGDDWYGFGFERPNASKGDNVSFSYEMNGNYKNVVKGSLKVLSSSDTPPATSKAGASGGTHTPTQLAISYQAARNASLAFWAIAQAAGALNLGSKKNEQVATLEGLVDEMTNQFFEDTKVLSKADPVPVGDSNTDVSGDD